MATFVNDKAPRLLGGGVDVAEIAAAVARAATVAATTPGPERYARVLGPLLEHVESVFEASAWAAFTGDAALLAALLKEKPLKMVGAKMNADTGRLVLG